MHYPNGVYIAFNLSRATEDKLNEYMEAHMPGAKKNEDFHSTLIYSKKPHEKRICRCHDRMKWNFKKFSKFWEDKKALVIEMESKDMKDMNHKMMKEHDLTSDYDEYNPHITLTYEGEDIDPEKLPPIDFELEMEHQIVEWIDEEAEKKDGDLPEKESDDEEEKDEEGYDKGFTM